MLIGLAAEYRSLTVAKGPEKGLIADLVRFGAGSLTVGRPSW